MGIIDFVKRPSMVGVERPHKLRICINSRYLNEAIQREYYPLLTIQIFLSVRYRLSILAQTSR